MRILCIGLNWKTPIRLRERLAFDEAKTARALARWKEKFTGGELAILSTCNRTELYAAVGDGDPHADIDDLAEFLASEQQLALPDFFDHLYFHEGAGAALHLFTVAGGLDSLILGEVQILGQVKQAYQQAIRAATAGPILHALFQKAIQVARRVQTETELTKGRLSIASAAVELVEGVFDRFDDKTVLVIGAGKMAELTLTHLREHSPRRLLVVNRTIERARDLARRFGGTVRPIEELKAALVESDIVLSSTGAERPLLVYSEFLPIMKARKNRLMAILDLAVPRDFDPAIAEVDNVLLSNIDDLEKIRDRTLSSRRVELDKALKIIDGETVEFQAALAMKQSGPIIGRLEQEYQRIIDQELDWLLPQLNGIPSEQREKILHFAHRLKNKFLHQPKTALREEARSGAGHGLLEAFRKLFGLANE